MARLVSCDEASDLVWPIVRWLKDKLVEFSEIQEDEFFYCLGLLYLLEGSSRNGILYLEQAAKRSSDIFRTRFALALALENSSLYHDSIAQYSFLLNEENETWFINYRIGNVFQKARQFHKAIDFYKKSLAEHDRFPRAWFNLGVAYQRVEKRLLAFAAYNRALELNPQYAEVMNAIGALYFLEGKTKTAKAFFKRSIETKKNYVHALVNLALAEEKLTEFHSAELLCEEILSISPHNVRNLSTFISISLKTCQWEKLPSLVSQFWFSIEKSRKKDIDLSFNLFDIFNLFLSPYQQRILSELRAGLIRTQNRNFCFQNRRRQKIRLGYVSSDFKDHPIGNLVQRLFKLHNRNIFKVYAYSIGQTDSSKYRRTIQKSCDIFRDLVHCSCSEISEFIYKDEIDILVDLNGYTGNSRPEIFAAKPAPIQVNYLGNPGTLGSTSFQYIITNKTLTPPEQETSLTEKCIFLPNCHQVINDKQSVPYHSNINCLSNSKRSFTYCCFNRVEKIDSTIFNVWMNILTRVPNSMLWLLKTSPEAEDSLIQHAANAHIDSERLVFIQPLSKDNWLRKQADADLFLDTLYFNAGVTAINALWAGVPVLTLPGETFISRVGASLLMSVDMPELIASSLGNYEDIAVDLANNTSKLSLLKKRLIEGKFSLPLFDVSRTVRCLEKGYMEAWENYLEGKSPVPIYVQDY